MMKRIFLIIAFLLFAAGICKAGSITYSSATIIISDFPESSPCTFEDIYQADASNGWNVVNKQDDNQYEFRCKLQIGDGSQETWLIDANKSISHTVNGDFIIIKKYGHLRLGKVVDEEKRTTKDGCYLYTTSNGKNIIDIWEGTLELYSTTITAKTSTVLYVRTPGSGHKIWNCNIIHTTMYGQVLPVDIYRTNWQSSTKGPLMSPTYADDVIISDCGTGMELSFVSDDITIRNYKMVNVGTEFYGFRFRGNLYAIDTECDWGVVLIWSSGKIYRQYTFNLKVVDENGNPISDVTVKVYDKNNNLIFEKITDANGQIPEQIITDGYFNPSFHSFSPHTLIVEKEGYETYQIQFTPTKPIDWEISLTEKEEEEGGEEVIIEMQEERKKGSMDEGLVLGLGAGIIFAIVIILIMRGGGRE